MPWRVSSEAAFERGGARWWVPEGADAHAAERLAARALAALAEGAKNEKTGRRKELYRVALEGDAPDHLLKLNHYARGASSFQRVRRSKARRELDVAGVLATRGIETPLPVAAGEVRRAGRLVCCYLLVPLLPDVEDLEQFDARPGVAGERRAWAEALGSLVRRLRDAGLHHDDFTANNLLLRRGPERTVLPVDFERARVGRRVGRAAAAGMLAKLERSLDRPRATERMRCVRAFAGGDRVAARRLWREVERASVRLAVGDLRRLRRISTAHRRRFERVAIGPWSGFARRDTPLRADVEKALAEPPAERAPGIEARGALWEVRSAGGPAPAERWALAQLLWRRRLAPRPVALVHRDGEARLWLERSEPADEAGPAEAARAEATLRARLASLGRLGAGLPGAVALETGPAGEPRAVWLDPGAFAPGGPTDAERRSLESR